MVLIAFFVVGIVWGLIRKGSFANIAEADFKAWFLFAIALLLFFALRIATVRGMDAVTQYAYLITLAAYCILILGIMFNLRSINLWMFFLLGGSLFNFAAIFLNSGRMPVSPAAMAIAKISESDLLPQFYSVMTDSIHPAIKYLCAIIPVPFPFGLRGEVISIGTVLTGIGLFGVVKNLLLGVIYVYEDDERYYEGYNALEEEPEEFIEPPAPAQETAAKVPDEMEADVEAVKRRFRTSDDIPASPTGFLRDEDERLGFNQDYTAGDIDIRSDNRRAPSRNPQLQNRDPSAYGVQAKSTQLGEMNAGSQASRVSEETRIRRPIPTEELFSTRVFVPVKDNPDHPPTDELLEYIRSSGGPAPVADEQPRESDYQPGYDASRPQFTEAHPQPTPVAPPPLPPANRTPRNRDEIILDSLVDPGGREDIHKKRQQDERELDDILETLSGYSEGDPALSAETDRTQAQGYSEPAQPASQEYRANEFQASTDGWQDIQDAQGDMEDTMPLSADNYSQQPYELPYYQEPAASMSDPGKQYMPDLPQGQELGRYQEGYQPEYDQEYDQPYKEEYQDYPQYQVPYTQEAYPPSLQPEQPEQPEQHQQASQEEDVYDPANPFIIVNGRIVENPYYKFRRMPNMPKDKGERNSPTSEANTPPTRGRKPNFSGFKPSDRSFDGEAEGYERVEMRVGDVQLKFFKKDNDNGQNN